MPVVRGTGIDYVFALHDISYGALSIGYRHAMTARWFNSSQSLGAVRTRRPLHFGPLFALPIDY